MKNSHQLSHDPIHNRENHSCIHVVRIDIPSDMPNIPVIADLVKRWKHSWNKNLEAPRHASVALQITTSLNEVSGFCRRGCVGAACISIQNRKDNFAKAASAQLGREPF